MKMESATNELLCGNESNLLEKLTKKGKIPHIRFAKSVKGKPEDNTRAVNHSNGESEQRYNVKYLGKRPTLGIWGLEFTRKPVDDLIALARASKKHTYPAVLEIFDHGIKVTYAPTKEEESSTERYFPIYTISYGVQDSVYTHIFSMIVVREQTSATDGSLFECRCFICDNGDTVVKITQDLSKAFKQCAANGSMVSTIQDNEEHALHLQDTDNNDILNEAEA